MKSLSITAILVVFTSIFLAFLVSLLPLPSWVEPFRPPCLSLVLIYWTVTLPGCVPLWVVWLLGLLLDALYGCLLGQHALALSLIVYLFDRYHLRIRQFPFPQQAFFAFLLVLMYQSLLV